MEEPVGYHIEDEAIALVTLNRPEARNAQDTKFLYALNDAFDRASRSSSVKVIILEANGPHFSAGHDLREEGREHTIDELAIGCWSDFGAPGQEGMMSYEMEAYLGLSERWRNIPKPMIAAVHGKCISGGLMLAWPCDIIIASSDAQFIDNTLTMGIPGTEWFTHPYELGPRMAKEMLFTAEPIGAADAHRLGLVNHVVERDRLQGFTRELALKIAARSSMALKLAKQTVNAFQDAQGRSAAMKAAFNAHQLAHSHCAQIFGEPIDRRELRFGKE